MEIKRNRQTLIVPIGVPGCGKSTFLKNIIDKQKSKGVSERDCLQVIEMDKIRSILPPVKNNEGLPQEYNNSVAKFSHEVLRTAMSYGLPLAYDATNLQERYLNNIISICEEYGYEPIFVPFEVERDELLKRNAERELSKQIDERIILSMCNSFDKLMSSEYWKKINERFTVVKPEEFEKVQPKIYELDNKNVHIIGDIHGNFSNLEKFFEAHPYSKDDQYIFLGDYFDRGDNDGIVKMYNFINNNIDKENVVFIWGNHEDHLNNYAKNQQYWSGFNGTRKVLEEASVTKEEINSILSKMPNYYIFEKNGEKFFCCHGGLIKYPNDEHDLLLYKRNTLVRGEKQEKDETPYETPLDDLYLETNDKSLQPPFQIYGHRNTEEFNQWASCILSNTKIDREDRNSVSLVDVYPVGEVNSNGENYLRTLTIDKDNNLYLERHEGLIKYRIRLREDKIIEETVNGETKEYDILNNPNIRIKELNILKSDGMIDKIYSANFTSGTFYKGKWDPNTKAARGLFLKFDKDDNIEIVARSYNKFFNANEINSIEEKLEQAPDCEEVVAYKKENGFLGIISEYDGELHFFSKSTNEGKFAEMVKEHFYKTCSDPEYVKKVLKENNCSLVVEVIDPVKDPHIIEYKESKVVVLDLIKNEMQFHEADYPTLVKFAEKAGMPCKEVYKKWNSKEDFYNWYKKYEESEQDEMKDIEGVVVCFKNVEKDEIYQLKVKSDHYKFVKAHRNDLARAINGKNLKNDDSFSHFIKMYVDAKKESGEEVQPDQIIQVYKAYVNYVNTHNRNS